MYSRTVITGLLILRMLSRSDYSSLPGGLFACAFFKFHMTIFATLVKPVRKGTSIWNFLGQDGVANSYFAQNQDGKLIHCESLDELRGLYQRMLKYGYGPSAF